MNAATRERGAAADSGRVLVMDDQDSVRAVVCRMLERLGYEAVGVTDGEEAIETFARARREGRPFAATVLDLIVPGGLGGAATLAALKRLDPQIVAVASTGYDLEQGRAEAGRHGFESVLVKPFTLAQLSAAMEEARLASPSGDCRPPTDD